MVVPREDPRVDVRVERLHPPAQQLGHLRELVDPRHLEPEALEEVRRAVARDELDPELGEAGAELVETGLVVGRQECPGDQDAISSRTTCGSRRCSAAWTRALSDSVVSPA